MDVLRPLFDAVVFVCCHPLQALLRAAIAVALLVGLANFVAANSHGPICGRTAAVTGVGQCDSPQGATETAHREPKPASKRSGKEHP